MTGKLFVVSAPSGAGKTTVVGRLLEELSQECRLEKVVTFTTKKPRPNEVHGIDYHFTTPHDFEQKIAQGFFVEWSGDYGNYYGSPSSIIDGLSLGKSYVVIVDLRGAIHFQKHVKESVLCWVHPKNLEQLQERLSLRGTESDEQLKYRIDLAKKEIERVSQNKWFKYHILNDKLDDAVERLCFIVRSELEALNFSRNSCKRI